MTGLVFTLSDKQKAIRQLYAIAELGKPEDQPTRSPEFMRLIVHPDQPRVSGDHLDFRDEILAQIYDKGESQPKRTLTFNIEVSDQGHTTGVFDKKNNIENWKRIGASYPTRPWLPTTETSSFISITRPGETIATTRPASPARGPMHRTARRNIMTVKRMDNVGIVVEDIDAAIEFFTELGLNLEGRAPIEGDWADGVTGLRDMRVEIAMMRTPDGHSRLELSRFLAPPVVANHRNAPVNALGYLRVMFTVEDIDDTLARLGNAAQSWSAKWSSTRTISALLHPRPRKNLIGLAQSSGRRLPDEFLRQAQT